MNPEHPEAVRFVADVVRLADEASEDGLYCAEAVLSALARAQGIDSELIPKVATAFCTGMAGTCGTCGALTGAIMGLGLSLGRNHERQPVLAAYAATQQLVRTFEKEFGARTCDQLLGFDIGTPAGRAAFEQRQLDDRCARYTLRAAAIAATLLVEGWEEGRQEASPDVPRHRTADRRAPP